MKQFTVVTGNADIVFHMPTSLDEISVDYLKAVTANVAIADNYTLVGIVYSEKLFDIIISRKRQQKGITTAVTPIFIRTGKTDSDFINSATCKVPLIIPSSSLNLGHHVAAPKNVLSLDYFIRAIDADNSLAKRYDNNFGNEKCLFVEFKLIPNVEIKGFYEKAEEVDSTEYVEVHLKNGGDC